MALMPWGEMMRAAMRMGVGPEGFWRLSLKEWRLLTEAGLSHTGQSQLYDGQSG